MTPDDHDLVAILVDLANRGHGVARRAAGRIVELSAENGRLRAARPGPGLCQECSAELTGRQRRWCSEACRHRHDRRAGSERVGRMGP